jgi:hemoglobin/transferrin/lactoferrin receptor protein
MRFRLLAGTVFSTLTFAALNAAHAQEAPAGPLLLASADEDDDQRNRVTVTATRTEKNVDEVPATVTVIDAEKIENELATDIKDLVRFEPGVSVRSSPSRFGAALGATGRDGNAGFNIRGLEGNRVLIQVDGVRVADAYGFGPQANGRGDFVDLDLLKSVEILRGPASALYGSDGVAGAVSFVTRDPDDLIQDGRAFAIRARSAYASADESLANSVIGATEFGPFSAMLAYTRRDASEQENMGENFALNSTRTAPNPTDFESDSYLGKLVWAPTDTQRIRFTYDRSDRDIVAEVFSGRTLPPPPPAPLPATAVIDLDAHDTSYRERYALDHSIEFGEGLLSSAQWSVYTQSSKTRQFTFENRNTAADRIRDNTFDNRISGASGQVDGRFDTSWGGHHWLLGADYSKTRQTSIRNGTVPPAGETFPSRPFPNTDYELTGVFVQDEISLLDGAITLFPALRYDAYKLDPERDALYPAALPAASSEDSRISPKFGAVIWPSDWFGAFFNYAAGYKAPSPSQVNSSFANPLQNYTSIANPDLKPESSNSVEAGVRTRNLSLFGAEWSGSASAFAADYEDFIEQVLISGSLTPTDPGVFQYINLTSVSVSGWEARIDGLWDNGLGFIASASASEGDQSTTTPSRPFVPLQSIDPLKIVAGLTYADPAGHFGGQIVATYSDAKDNQRIAENQPGIAAADLFSPRSFVILDITAYWNITDWAALRVGAFNVTDEKYWWWSDVRGVSATSATRDAFTQPGANYSASLTFRY